MDLLKRLFRSAPSAPASLPTGSFTVDAEGRLLASTVSQVYPRELLELIGGVVLRCLHQSQGAGQPLTEMVIHYASFTLNVRELRGGALISLAPPKKKPA